MPLTLAPVSPSELLKNYLRAHADPSIIKLKNIVAGALNHEQQQEGGVSLTDAGMPKMELGLPTVWVRSQVRCIAGQLYRADEVGRHMWELMSYQNRVTAMDVKNRTFLIHIMYVVAGPSQHKDSEVTDEELMFTNLMVHTEPLT